MSIKLHNSNILDEETVSFIFIVEEFTDLKEKSLSKSFFFGGHRWRLQGAVEDGFLGLFLRWAGGGKSNEKLKCTAIVEFGVVNRKDPLQSVFQGNLQEEDEFPKVGAGVGWSRMISEKQLLGTDGFIDKDDTLLVELKMKMGSTIFTDDLPVKLTADNYNSSKEFSLCGSNWRLALFPRGDVPIKKSAPHDNASLYLYRLEPTLLRYKVKFMFLLEGARQVPIVHHFQSHTDGCASGIEKILRTRDLKATAKANKGRITVGVKIISIEPYFFFAMDTKTWQIPKQLDPSYPINDQCDRPFMFKVLSSENNDLDFQLVYDPEGENDGIDDSFYYVKLNWSVMVFSFKDEKKSVRLRSSDIPGKSCFCYSESEMTLSTLIHLEQVARKNGIYVDDDQLLSVRLAIEYSNEHYDPLMEEGADKDSVAQLREVSNQQIMSLQKKWQKEMDEAIAEKDLIIAEQAEELVKKELIIDQQETALHELDDDFQDAQGDYYDDLEDGMIDEDFPDKHPDNDKTQHGKIIPENNTSNVNQENEDPSLQSGSIPGSPQKNLRQRSSSPQKNTGEAPPGSPQKGSNEIPGSPQKSRRSVPSPTPRPRQRKYTSIQRLIRDSKPDLEEIKDLKTLAETLGTFLGKELPFNVDCVTVVGAVGQGTCLKGKQELDLAILIKELPCKAHSSWLPAVAYSIRTVLKNSLSKNSASKKSRVQLPPCSNFNSCHDSGETIMFKCGDVDVVLIPTNSCRNSKEYSDLYETALKEGPETLPYFSNAVCRRQTEFIYKQTDKCKDLILVVKQWRDSVNWQNEESRPSSYLLSLLVVLSYQVVGGGGENKMNMEKDILTEFAEIANDPELYCYWEDYYLTDKYPRSSYPKPFALPIVQDPALPHHNVAETGLKDWTQFRQEVGVWVDTLAN